MPTIAPNLRATPADVADFCRKWRIVRFELFGSVLRDDFDEESDVDVLVSFAPGESPRIGQLIEMEAELMRLLGRRVDVVERELVERSRNWIRRKHILNSAHLIYAAA